MAVHEVLGALTFILDSCNKLRPHANKNMLSNHSVMVLALWILGLVLVVTIIGLVVHYGYTLPNFFYGDWVVLSTNDSTDKTWWVKNDRGAFTFVEDPSNASVLRFYPGPTGTTGQLFESSAAFELFHPYRGAYMTASCKGGGATLDAEFSTTTGSQLVAAPAIVAGSTGSANPFEMAGSTC